MSRVRVHSMILVKECVIDSYHLGADLEPSYICIVSALLIRIVLHRGIAKANHIHNLLIS